MTAPRFAAALLSTLLCAALAGADDAPPRSAIPGVQGLRVLDLDGQVHRLGGRAGDEAVVIVLIGTECPISNRSIPTLRRLAALARERGLGFFGLLADPYLSRDEARAHAREYEPGFPLIFDSSLELARLLEPSVMPQAWIIDPSGALRYEGAIDDSWSDLTRPKARTGEEYLKDAMLAVAAGEAVAKPRTEAIGCFFEAGKQARTGPKEVTWTRDVAPILYKSCATCHRPGEAAPFPLLDYEDAARRAQLLAAVTEQRIMPPWQPAEGHGEFLDEMRLSPREVAILGRWADAGAPRGEPADAPKRPEFTEGWKLGEPDLVLTMDEAYEVAADGPDDFRCFVIPTGLDGARQVVGMEYRPGAPTVVHHAILFLDNSGRGRELDAAEAGPGYKSFGGIGFNPSGSLGGYSPGAQPSFLPAGVARRLRKREDIILQVHYHPTGKVERDQGRIGLFFAKEPVKKRLQGLVMGNRAIDIPAGHDAYTRGAELTLPKPVELLGVTPHMHYLGASMKIDARRPDGELIPLIWIKEWDFRWQGQYWYRQPVRLPEGTVITLSASYDNSADNPANPSSPPRRVTFGDASTDEMCFAFFQLTVDDPKDMRPLREAMGLSFLQAESAPQPPPPPAPEPAPPEAPKAPPPPKEKRFF